MEMKRSYHQSGEDLYYPYGIENLYNNMVKMTSLLYFGQQWIGSTSIQRLKAFQQIDGVLAVGIDNNVTLDKKNSTWQRIRWRLRFPVDVFNERDALIKSVEYHKPDIVLVDNCKVINCKTLRHLRELGCKKLVYYSPDDIYAKHNLSFPLKWSLPHWDIVCTTKTFNIPELLSIGVRHPLLIGKSFDLDLHHPWAPADVGGDFENFDAVFIGTFEKERCDSINTLAEAGISVIVWGNKEYWRRKYLHPSIELRNAVFGEEYVRAWHTGKVALCFLRKLNRDRITQRSVEIAAIGRPMVAERTDEHDAHFLHGKEYLGFHTNEELVEQVKMLIGNNDYREKLAKAARERCLQSGYSSLDRAKQMIDAFLS